MFSRSVRPGCPATKTSSSSVGARLAPLQIVLELGRLAVLVDAEEADVEIVARILEVVRVAAEEGDVLLRREDQPHVGVLLVAVEMVLPALVERDHVAAQPGLVERFLFDRVHHGAAGLLAPRPASMPGLTAALTRSVTSSMLISTFNSRSTHFISSSRVRA